MKVTAWFVDNFHYYVVFSKAILFISGLIFSYSLVEKSLFSTLMVHLSDMWKHSSLPKFALIVNLQEGIYEVLQIFFAYVADAFWGLFPMLLCSTTINIIGLWLFFITSRPGVLYIALVLVTLSQAAEKVPLQSFLGDQLLAMEPVEATTEEQEQKAYSRTNFWWLLLSLLAAVASFFLSLSNFDSNFQQLSLVSAISMSVGFLWFLLGTNFYKRNEPTARPLTHVATAIFAAITNPNTGENSAKIILSHLPLWTTFLTFSLIQATGSTFFLAEATNINEDFPVLFFILLQRFAQFIVAELCDYVTEKLDEKNKKIAQSVMLLRIGIGMTCSVPCCILAWINALHWLRLLQKYSNPEKHTTVFRLIPQYLLLGIMGGLSEEGLRSFFDSQVSKSISRYGPPFGECVMGIGKFLSIICTLFFSKIIPWIKDDINSSRLDKYYAVLAGFSLVNLIPFWILAYRYGGDQFFSEDQIELENTVEILVEGGSFGHNVTENTRSEQSQSQSQEDPVPLLKFKTRKEINTSSSVLPNDEAVRENPDSLMINQALSFPRPSSKGIQKRFHSMKY